MSIFGKKQRYIGKAEDPEGLAQQLTNFRQEVHNSRGLIIRQINTFNDRVSQLQENMRQAVINNSSLNNKIERIKHIITVFAESKGPMKKGKIFSFGNGGRESTVGYVLVRPGRVMGMGLSSKKGSETLWVTISVDGKDQLGYGVSLNDQRERKQDNFTTPLEIRAGSVISFVSQSDVPSSENAVVSVLIELL